jgi:methylated-DNA-[protein]-cysteine S-methyltransferase
MTKPEYFTTYFQSPLGPLKISGSPTAVQEVLFWQHSDVDSHNEADHLRELPELARMCIAELTEYFEGTRRHFDVPVSQAGTAFQQRVWNELVAIPYGKTISYLELSRRIGDVKAIRAAASTNGKNKLAVIVPCHRVIGSNRDLVGYAGGLHNKRWLLEHEAKFACGVQTLFSYGFF